MASIVYFVGNIPAFLNCIKNVSQLILNVPEQTPTSSLGMLLLIYAKTTKNGLHCKPYFQERHYYEAQ